jgi:2'-5' RNA ligase
VRLFVAFELPDGLRREVGRRIDEARRQLPAARWVRPEGLHLTLKFLGETAASAVADLGVALGPAFATAPALSARLGAGGCFPPGRPARVAWLGVEVARADGGNGAEASDALAALHRRVEEAAREVAGVAAEGRPFRAHVTLARPDPPWGRPAVEAFGRAFADERAAPLAASFPLDHGALIESRLGPGGARYRTVAIYPLNA